MKAKMKAMLEAKILKYRNKPGIKDFFDWYDQNKADPKIRFVMMEHIAIWTISVTALLLSIINLIIEIVT